MGDKWRGTITVTCPSCSSTDDINVTVPEGMNAIEVGYTCDRCNANQRIVVSKVKKTEVDVTG